MREIKFRAWYKDRMIPWVENLEDGTGGVRMYFSQMIVDKNVILLQFTGLKDKNGKECFEGDIIKNGDYVEDADAWNEWIREVEWIDEEAKFIGVAEGEQWEIIGNKYETP